MANTMTPEIPWLMTTSAEAKLAKLEERVEGQGRTLARIDGNLNRIAGVLEKVAVQTTKIEHMDDILSRANGKLQDHDQRIMVNERDLVVVHKALESLREDFGEITQEQRRHSRILSRHAPVIAVVLFIAGTVASAVAKRIIGG